MLNIVMNIAKMMDLAAFLQDLRMAFGYTQKQIALELNIQDSTYNRYESGKHNIKLKEFIELLKLYGPGAYKKFTDYLQENGLDVTSAIVPDHYSRVEEVQQKYEKASQKRTELERELAMLQREIGLLNKISQEQDQRLKLMEKMLEKNQ